MKVILIILWSIIGYLIGSISWSLIIGKVFFKKDIRKYGSGNLGGTNAGRVLGKPIGILVITLDISKALLVMIVCNKLAPVAVEYAGFAVCIGHCFPLFAQFNGGKAVACSDGFLLGIGFFKTGDIIFSTLYPFLIFVIVLCLSKMVSLSSMISLIFATLIAFTTFKDTHLAIMTGLLTTFVIYRHKTNIFRILRGEESKVKFIK